VCETQQRTTSGVSELFQTDNIAMQSQTKSCSSDKHMQQVPRLSKKTVSNEMKVNLVIFVFSKPQGRTQIRIRSAQETKTQLYDAMTVNT
jgi:hypothetical protein